MSVSATSLLTVKHLRKSFGGVQAVSDVSFDLAAGQILALLGPNGAGKSTCFNMLNGQLRPNGGSILLDGVELVGMKPRQVWRAGVGRTFQIAVTYGSMTVLENIQMALLSLAGKTYNLWTPVSDLYRDEAMHLLTMVGMAEQADRPCSILAYGDIKHVELAVALANKPRLLLMDEPTAGMAPRERVELMALTAQIARTQNVAVLFTEHDMDVVFTHADRLIVLSRGKLLAAGTPNEVRENPEVQRVYLGSAGSH